MNADPNVTLAVIAGTVLVGVLGGWAWEYVWDRRWVYRRRLARWYKERRDGD